MSLFPPFPEHRGGCCFHCRNFAGLEDVRFPTLEKFEESKNQKEKKTKLSLNITTSLTSPHQELVPRMIIPFNNVLLGSAGLRRGHTKFLEWKEGG